MFICMAHRTSSLRAQNEAYFCTTYHNPCTTFFEQGCAAVGLVVTGFLRFCTTFTTFLVDCCKNNWLPPCPLKTYISDFAQKGCEGCSDACFIFCINQLRRTPFVLKVVQGLCVFLTCRFPYDGTDNSV